MQAEDKKLGLYFNRCSSEAGNPLAKEQSMRAKRGCGVLFHNKQKSAVLLFRRDDKSGIPFPNMLDILGGGVEPAETPEEALRREMGEELLDKRTQKPYVLEGHKLFLVYTDVRDCQQHIFTKEADFAIEDVLLLEGQELVWLADAGLTPDMKLAFGFEAVVRDFFERSPIEG